MPKPNPRHQSKDKKRS
jgi:hypothetical protein